jgi:sec-independent protein translocase protein TatC
MTLTAHLGELRKRITVSVIAVSVGFVVAFHFSESIFRLLTVPMRADVSFKAAYPFLMLVPKAHPVEHLVFLAPAEAFWVHLKVSLITGLIAMLPVIFYQFWKFISPGLLEKEKKYTLPFIFIATGLFFFGVVFCFGIVLPFAMRFLLNYKTGTLTPMISVERYIDFCLKFTLAFGAIFELPLVLVFMTRMGFVTPKTLAKNRKYAVLFSFVAAAILTPTPDAFNQTLMAVPIVILYEGGIIASRLFAKKRQEQEEEPKRKDKEEEKQ